MLMLRSFDGLEQLVRMDAIAAIAVLYSLVSKLLFGVLAVVSVIAAIDFIYQRFENMKQMRMSRQEIKDEFKQSEGDPAVKQRIRQVHQERSRQRVATAVPEASVVIANPAHKRHLAIFGKDSFYAKTRISTKPTVEQNAVLNDEDLFVWSGICGLAQDFMGIMRSSSVTITIGQPIALSESDGRRGFYDNAS